MKPLLSLATCLLLATASLGHAQEAPSFQGEWALAGSVQAAETRRDAAIEGVTDEMNLLVRGIAGRRLRSGMPIPRAITIEGEGSSFRAKVGDFDLRFAPDGARHEMVDPFDNDIRASQQLNGRRLQQVMRSDGGRLTHTLQLSEDGQTITLTVRVGSGRLPADVVYRIRFRRR